MRKRKRGLLPLLAFASLSLSLVLLAPVTPVLAQDTQKKTEEMKNEIQSTKDRLANTEKEIESIKGQTGSLQQKLKDLDLQSEALEEDRKKLQEQIDEAEKTLLYRREEQAKAEKDLLKKKEQYQKRMSAMFYFRKLSPVEILLGSKGMDGFFSNLRMISAVAASDTDMIQDLRHTEEIRAAATELANRTHEEFLHFMEEKMEQIDKLNEGIELTRQELSNYNQLLNNRTLELQDIQQDLAQKEAAFAAYQAALARYAGQISQLNPAGHNAVWPLPASQEIYSPYGYRTLGVDASNGYVHTGTDFAGPNVAGSPVVAAWEGIVVTVHQPYPGQMYAPDANYVQISHGAGLGTGYWHLLSCSVVPGQYVAKGQVIGYCGSTGMSTGPHLHFEVYDETNPAKGVRNTVDPMLYLGG